MSDTGDSEMVKKILRPLDRSDHAFKALDFASDLAEKYGAALLVLYVVTKHERRH